MPLRSFTWNDLPAYARLISEAGRVDGARAPFTERDADEYLRQPNLRPERDCFLAEADGVPAGYALVVPELSIGRSIVEGVVHPAFRRRGIGGLLLERAVQQSRDLGAKLAHASTTPSGVAAQRLLAGFGFHEASRQWQMRLELKDLSRGKPGSGYQVRSMTAGEEPVLTDLQNRAFGGSWGFAPNAPEEVVYRTRMGGAGPEETLFLIVEGRPVAYCWTSTQVLDGEQVGIVWMIGADPDVRGRGFGRAMLLESVDYLAGRGAQAIELTVYQDNRAAVELYRATGFRERGEIIWYERAL